MIFLKEFFQVGEFNTSFYEIKFTFFYYLSLELEATKKKLNS